jgi:hypothetical protein
MALLAGKCYDPQGGAVVQKTTAGLLAMTALDTTNLRLTFTAPASGNVLVRMRAPTIGASTFPAILLGVLDGATVKLRMSPMGAPVANVSTSLVSQEVCGLVTGLTPGNSYTWDAAYSVDVVLASTNLEYGGPDNATGTNAAGGFVFEVWDTPTLLGGVLYDFTTTAVTKAVGTTTAMAAFDTTNLRLTVTAPASGNIMWRVHTTYSGNSTPPALLLGVMESSTVVGRVAPIMGMPQSLLAASRVGLEASGIMTGVTAGSHTYDAAWAVQTAGGGGGIKYGGPDDTTTNNAFGGIAFELWSS